MTDGHVVWEMVGGRHDGRLVECKPTSERVVFPGREPDPTDTPKSGATPVIGRTQTHIYEPTSDTDRVARKMRLVEEVTYT